MFEQAVLESSYGNRRAFATGAGFAGQAALAAFILIAPMIWPQVLPRPRLTMTIAPPPAPAPPEHTAAVRPRAPHSPAPMMQMAVFIPTRMPPQAQQISDVGPGPIALPGIAGGIGTGSNDLIGGILNATIVIPKPIETHPKPIPPVEEVKRIRVSNLDPGRLIHFVEPVYPQIAKNVHISGTVELRAVIGTDGRVRQLDVISGHPLLRNSAIEAVRQWIYKPPVLNGESVELVAPVAVIFRLN